MLRDIKVYVHNKDLFVNVYRSFLDNIFHTGNNPNVLA